MQTYTIRAGDTLGKIAKKFYGDPARFQLIVASNQIGNPDRLVPGAQLVIPDVSLPVTVPSAPAPLAGGTDGTIRLNEQRLSGLCPSLVAALSSHRRRHGCGDTQARARLARPRQELRIDGSGKGGMPRISQCAREIPRKGFVRVAVGV